MVYAYYILDGNNIQCRLRNLIIDTGPAQVRFTEYQRAFISAIRGDELLSEDRSREQVEVHIGELYCGCAYGRTKYVYRSQEQVEDVMERYARDIGVPGWSIQYSYPDWVKYRNADNTVAASISIRSHRRGAPTVYEVLVYLAEPSLSKCHGG